METVASGIGSGRSDEDTLETVASGIGSGRSDEDSWENCNLGYRQR
jgi:hypothetical protein